VILAVRPTRCLGLFVLACLSVAGAGCGGGRSAHWESCRYLGSDLRVSRFLVRGGVTCSRANVLVAKEAGSFEGGCGSRCEVVGYTCSERPGRLVRNGTGGSYYSYTDVRCQRGDMKARWRVSAVVG
jgi:hypothetical protein